MKMMGNGFLPQIGGGGSVAFSPLDVGTCKWWLDASNLSSLYQDSARSSAVVADGDPVGSFGDLSGNAKHANQATAGLRPLYKTGVINGLPIVRYDGVDDQSIVASVVSTQTTTFEMFLVAKANNISSARLAMFNGNGSNGYGISQSTAGSSKKGALIAGYAWIGTTAADTAWTIYLLRRTGGTTSSFINGGSADATNGSVPATPTTQAQIGSGAAGTVGNVDVAEALFYEGLTTGEANQVGAYLADKWGLTWTDI